MGQLRRRRVKDLALLQTAESLQNIHFVDGPWEGNSEDGQHGGGSPGGEELRMAL